MNTTATFCPDLLSVEIVGGHGMVSLEVCGELDLYNQPRLARAFELLWSQPALPPLVRVDISGLRFMDSSGLSLLIAARLRAEELGRELVVCGATPRIARIFEVTGLTELLGGARA